MGYKIEQNRQYGEWLSRNEWVSFSTVTYKFNVNRRRNRQIMEGFTKSLHKKNIPHKVFWVMEDTSNGYQTHNHLLLEGDNVQYELNKYLKEKNLVDERFVKHVAYNASLGASHYVSKFISSDNADYDISFKKD